MSPKKPLIPMGMKILFLFIAIPLVEILTIFWLFQQTGFFFTVSIIILSAIVGVSLMKREWRHVFGKVQKQGLKGQHPGELLVEGMLLLLAGAFLISPGIFTDIVGYTILIPPIRRLYMAVIQKNFQSKIQSFATGRAGAGGARGFSFQFGSGGFGAAGFGGAGQGSPFPGVNPAGRPEAENETLDNGPTATVENSTEGEASPFADKSPYGRKK